MFDGGVFQAPFYSYDRRSKYVYREEKVQGAVDANIGYFEVFGIGKSRGGRGEKDAGREGCGREEERWRRGCR